MNTVKLLPPPNHLKEKPESINNTELVAAFRAQGGHLLHIRPVKGRRRGMTAAYTIKGGRIECATSLAHRNDGFSKKHGTKTAIEHFNAGKTVTLPFVGVENLKVGLGLMAVAK